MQYYVYSNLSHNRKDYVRGDKVDLSESEAQPLIDANVVGAEKPTVDPVPAPVTAQEPEPEATIGGTGQETGEPSIDAPNANPVPTEAEDITPKVSDRMTREELEAVAKSEGIAAGAIEAASTKTSLVSLIEANRNPEPAPSQDPSANL